MMSSSLFSEYWGLWSHVLCSSSAAAAPAAAYIKCAEDPDVSVLVSMRKFRLLVK